MNTKLSVIWVRRETRWLAECQISRRRLSPSEEPPHTAWHVSQRRGYSPYKIFIRKSTAFHSPKSSICAWNGYISHHATREHRGMCNAFHIKPNTKFRAFPGPACQIQGAAMGIHSENNYKFIALRQMMLCIAFSAGVIYRINAWCLVKSIKMMCCSNPFETLHRAFTRCRCFWKRGYRAFRDLAASDGRPQK